MPCSSAAALHQDSLSPHHVSGVACEHYQQLKARCSVLSLAKRDKFIQAEEDTVKQMEEQSKRAIAVANK
jgi:hypothetical protein